MIIFGKTYMRTNGTRLHVCGLVIPPRCTSFLKEKGLDVQYVCGMYVGSLVKTKKFLRMYDVDAVH